MLGTPSLAPAEWVETEQSAKAAFQLMSDPYLASSSTNARTLSATLFSQFGSTETYERARANSCTLDSRRNSHLHCDGRAVFDSVNKSLSMAAVSAGSGRGANGARRHQ